MGKEDEPRKTNKVIGMREKKNREGKELERWEPSLGSDDEHHRVGAPRDARGDGSGGGGN